MARQPTLTPRRRRYLAPQPLGVRSHGDPRRLIAHGRALRSSPVASGHRKGCVSGHFSVPRLVEAGSGHRPGTPNVG